MKKKGFTPEEIIGKLREAEVLLGQGARWAKRAETLVSPSRLTISGERAWRIRVDQTQRFKELEK